MKSTLEVDEEAEESHRGTLLAEGARDDFWWLELLFSLCMLPTSKRPSPAWRSLNRLYCIFVLVGGYGSSVYILITTTYDSENFSKCMGSIWAFNVTTVFLLLSHAQSKSPDLIENLRCISQPSTHRLMIQQREESSSVCKVPVLLTIAAWLINVVSVSFNTTDIIKFNLGLSDNIVYIIFAAYINYHILFLCWFIPVPIVHSACQFLSRKVNYMHKVVATQFSQGGDIDLITLTDMYMELYHVNIYLNGCVSLIFTMVSILLSIFLFFTLFVIVNVDVLSPRMRVYFMIWSAVNLCVLACVCVPAANLEVLNKKFQYILGEFPLHSNTATDSMLQYQTLRTKVASCPFGIRIYGMSYEMSFGTLITLSSIWGSMFVFLVGTA